MNFSQCDQALAKEWTAYPDSIPQSWREWFINNDIPLDNLTAQNIKACKIALGFTYHESADGYVYIIKTCIHDKIPHSGGVAFAKICAEISVGWEFLHDLFSTTPKSVYGSLMSMQQVFGY